MRGIWIIFWRELKQYLLSPVAYLIAAAFLLLTGFLFNNDLVLSVTVKAASPVVVPALPGGGLAVAAGFGERVEIGDGDVVESTTGLQQDPTDRL